MRNLLLLTIALLCNTAGATRISLDEASKIAANFFGEKTTAPKHTTLRNAPELNKGYYIFTNEANDAFVILSGDTRMPQVLAFSRDNGLDFDNVPPQLPEFLNAYTAAYEYVTESGDDISTPCNVKSSPILYQTYEWGQQVPFNSLCPSPYTGCGATAMAIKMKYHNYPERGAGSHSYTLSSGETLSMDFDFDYNYSLMNSDFKEDSYTESQAEAVAKLMYACGVAIDMQYGPYESWAYMSDFVMMAKYFGYSNDIQALCRENFSNDTWLELLDNELDNVGPVIYRGSDSNDNNGHFFLIDGRDISGFYHINWGWNGNYNGYFRLDALTPGNYDYSYNDWMVINAKPETSGEFTPIILTNYNGGHGVSYNRNRIEANDSFFTTMSRLENRDNERHSGSIAIALTDESGRIRQILNEASFDLPSGYGYESYIFSRSISDTDAAEGDLLSVLYKTENDTEWHSVISGYDTRSSVSAWNFTPEYACLKWEIDTDISLTNTNNQYTDRALKYAPYYFIISYDSTLTDPLVIVNGEEISTSGSWYSIPFVNSDEYTIKITDKNNSGVSELIADIDGEVSIYTMDGISVYTASNRTEALRVITCLSKGAYLLRNGNKAEIFIN